MESFPFTNTATQEPPNILNGMTPKEFLKAKYTRGCIFGRDNLMHTGVYKVAGWSFDFKPYMKLFVVEQYNQLRKQYAPNRTALQNATYGKIKILAEIPIES